MAANRGALRRLHNRAQQISTKLQASPNNTTDVQLDKLYKAIAYETQSHFCNAQGRTGTFADFVTASIASLAPRAPTLQALTPTLERYPTLSPLQRQHVATRLMHVLTALQQQANSQGVQHIGALAQPRKAASVTPQTTAAFREQFRQAAMAMARTPTANNVVFEGDQRTAAWHALRDRRLTASAFANALGMGLVLGLFGTRWHIS